MVLILEPETPGGLRASMARRFVSTSATADDMVDSLLVKDRTTLLPTCLVSFDQSAFSRDGPFSPQYGVQQRSGRSEKALLLRMAKGTVRYVRLVQY